MRNTNAHSKERNKMQKSNNPWQIDICVKGGQNGR